MRPAALRACASTPCRAGVSKSISTRLHFRGMSSAASQPNNPQHERASQFTKSALDKADLDSRPFPQFRAWFDEASKSIPQHFACTLSTAELPSGRVSARQVYLKDIEAPDAGSVPDGGFVVYTNMGTSRKAADVDSNPHAALTFWWREMERQVRIEGRTERLTTAQSQPYFDSRVRGSRIGAWASPQSQVLDGREELERRVSDIEDKFAGTGNDVEDGSGSKEKIPCPDFWGGLRVIPDIIEFWQGRENRLHDRFRYTRLEGGPSAEWKMDRLSP